MNNNPTIALRTRFVNDHKIPIDLLYDDHMFYYFLDLYESTFKSRTKYDKLLETVNTKFDGKPQLFLENYHNVREKLITDLSENEFMKEFNSQNTRIIDLYNLPSEENQYPSKSIYNNSNDRKIFISFDLVKANFSALMYHNSKIFNSEKPISYNEWISRYTDLDYIINSKYTRQVVFGKLNPSRQIKVEKFMIWKALKHFKDLFEKNQIEAKVVSFNVDEVVFETSLDVINLWDKILDDIETIKEENIPIKATVFNVVLKRFKTFNDSNIDVYQKIFYRGNKETWMELKSVPLCFYAQVHKLINDMPISEYDLTFWTNDQPAKFIKPLKLVETIK